MIVRSETSEKPSGRPFARFKSVTSVQFAKGRASPARKKFCLMERFRRILLARQWSLSEWPFRRKLQPNSIPSVPRCKDWRLFPQNDKRQPDFAHAVCVPPAYQFVTLDTDSAIQRAPECRFFPKLRNNLLRFARCLCSFLLLRMM